MRLYKRTMTNDLALLRRARNLDEDALAEIYDSFSPMIYGYALRLSGDAATAEECVAETFSRFLTSLHNGQGPKEYLKAYLYRVAHNWITDLYRRARPETALDPELRAGDGFEPHMAVAELLEQQELRVALARLTDDQRQVIALKYLEEMGHAEIAQMLQKPVGAVKALQHRGLAALRRILAPESREGFGSTNVGPPQRASEEPRGGAGGAYDLSRQEDRAPWNGKLSGGKTESLPVVGDEEDGILPADG